MRTPEKMAEQLFQEEYGRRVRLLQERETAFHRDRFAEVDKVAQPLREQLANATLIIAELVRQLGGAARIPQEAMLLHGTDAGSLDSWVQPDTSELCFRVGNVRTKGGE